MSRMITLNTIGQRLSVLVVASAALLCIGVGDATGGPTINWPTRGWYNGTPAGVGLDEKILGGLGCGFCLRKIRADRQFPGLSLRRESLGAHVLPRLCGYLWERSQDQRPAERPVDGTVQLFRSRLAPLLPGHGLAHDAIGQQDSHVGHSRNRHHARRLQGSSGYSGAQVF